MKKILKIATYTSGAITILLGLLFIFINFIAPLLFKIPATNADSIGIIGGADGPTEVFVATNTTEGMSLEILIVFFAVITTILFLLKRSSK